MKPLVSIIMPIYNKVNYIYASTESIISQSYNNWELIIIDDGSTDGSTDVLKTAKTKKIRVIFHEKNEGVVKSYLDGFAAAKGKYIMLHDSDDLSMPDRIEKCLRYIGDADVLYHSLYTVNFVRDTPIPKFFYKKYKEWNKNRIYKQQYIPGVIFAKADILKKIDIPKEAFGAWDWMLHIKLHEMGAKYKFLDECLYQYFRDPKNSLSLNNENTGIRWQSMKFIDSYLREHKLIGGNHKYSRGFTKK